MALLSTTTAAAVDALVTHEQVVSWMYLDTATEAKVTVGLGIMLPNESAAGELWRMFEVFPAKLYHKVPPANPEDQAGAHKLKYYVGEYNKPPREPSQPDEQTLRSCIISIFRALRAVAPAQDARSETAKWAAYGYINTNRIAHPKLAELYLRYRNDQAVNHAKALLRNRFVPKLVRDFPQFYDYPRPCRRRSSTWRTICTTSRPSSPISPRASATRDGRRPRSAAGGLRFPRSGTVT
jgi:hypothetical protein